MKTIYQNEKFSLKTHHTIPHEEVALQNIDFWIIIDRQTFWGSATTTENIQYLMQKNKQTGACALGAYHWQSNTIILGEFTVECLAVAVADILEDESLAVDQVFYLIPDDNE